MTNYELLKANRDLAVQMYRRGINVDDVRYLSLYEDFVLLSRQTGGRSQAVYDVAQRHRVSERNVWNIIKRFEYEQ